MGMNSYIWHICPQAPVDGFAVNLVQGKGCGRNHLCHIFSRASRTAEHDSGSQDAACMSVCMYVCENFFPTNPYLQAGLTDLDEIWHDGRS